MRTASRRVADSPCGRLRLLLLITVATMTGAAETAAQNFEVALEVLADGFAAPVAFAMPPGESDVFYVVDQTGQVWGVGTSGVSSEEPFLDVSDRMIALNPGYDERGLLGMAFHPEFQTNGRFYVYYSAPLRAGGPSGWNHTSHVSAFSVSESDPTRADPASEEIILQVDQPQGNHNGGALAFGPDGYLYISLGDGGGANDTGPGHTDDWYGANAGGNAQNVTNLLGSILRIDVDGGAPYAIPPDNPFVGREGLDEIWAYGFRNPYRLSFDLGESNMLLVGDVGQNRWEEVSVVQRGGNYGWNVYEGTHCFDTSNPNQDASSCPTAVGPGHPDEGAPLIPPVIEYPNGQVGVAVVGGVMYRGSSIPELQGRYIFGDWNTSIGTRNRALLVASPQEAGLWPFEDLNVAEGALDPFLLGFGQDAAGEVYVLTTATGGPAGTSGRVQRLIPTGGVASESDETAPEAFTLFQNYPNPFNPSTAFQYRLGSSGDVQVRVFDLLGRPVSTLVGEIQSAGSYTVTWDGTDHRGEPVSSGIYIYRLLTEHGQSSRTMTLIR